MMSYNYKKIMVLLAIVICFQCTFASCKQGELITPDTIAPLPDREQEEEDKVADWSQKEFVLSTFFALPGSGDATQYRRILTHTKNAEINLVELSFIPPEALLVALNVAEEVGVRTLAQNLKIYSGIGDTSPPISEAALVSEIDFLKRFKMLEGYYVWDEPYEANFESVKTLNQLLKKHDPGRLAFSTLYPSYGVYNWEEGEYNWENNTYAQYVTQYLQQTDPAVLSFNYYPYRDNKESTSLVQNDLWKDFGYIRQKALEYNKPLWYYFQAVSIDPQHPGVMNLERIRAQMHGALAYGVKGLSYYTTYGALLTESFEKSVWYDDLTVLNKKVKNIGNLLLEATSNKVYHTGLNANMQQAYFLDSFSESNFITAAPNDLIIGILENDNKSYIIISNKSHLDTVSGDIEFDREYSISKFNPELNVFSDNHNVSEIDLSLAPGGIAVYLID